jgi:hypothetical protein
LTYAGAKENTLGSLPEGIELFVPVKKTPWKVGDEVAEFDFLDNVSKNVGLVNLINELPPVVSQWSRQVVEVI